MNRNRAAAVDFVLREEGGYVDHPKDPGGATNMGVTLSTYRRYVNPSGTKDDLRQMPRSEAETVYVKQYWHPVMGDDLPAGLDLAVFDFAINSGPKRAIRYLQEVLGNVEVDGVVGPQALGEIAKRNIPDLIVAYMARRERFLQALKTWSTFGKGWGRRVNRIRAEALRMHEAAQKAREAEIAMIEQASKIASTGGGLAQAKPALKSVTVWGSSGAILAALNAMAQRGIDPLSNPFGFATTNANELAIVGASLLAIWGRLRARYIIG